MTPTICIYHGNCADGFGAAWAIWKRFGDVATRYHAGVYGKSPPDVTGEHVLLVDFSYKRPVLEQMASVAASITVLDHHKTAEADLRPMLDAGTIQGEFDMNRSGAMMAWQWAWPDKPAPKLIQHIEDRDLWRFALPGTRAIQATLFSYPYDFAVWDELIADAENAAELEGLVAEGMAIERKHFKDIAELVAVSARPMLIGGHKVMVANLPYTMSSDAAGQLSEGQPFAACYMDTPDGRVFSLRSRGDQAVDVSEIAQRFGGGGHKNAAGFTAPIGWEGEGPTPAATEQ